MLQRQNYTVCKELIQIPASAKYFPDYVFTLFSSVSISFVYVWWLSCLFNIPIPYLPVVRFARPTLYDNHPYTLTLTGFGAQLIGPIQLHEKKSRIRGSAIFYRTMHVFCLWVARSVIYLSKKVKK